jgi:hypothetical protein
MAPLNEVDLEIRDSSIYWFFTLEAAKDRGDFETAARAQRELRRLGITVTYRRRAATTKRRADRKEPRHAE